MGKTVLILGGQGRIGRAVAQDLVTYTDAHIITTGRQNLLGSEYPFLNLDLAEKDKLRKAIQQADLVIHCAGPFHYRDGSVLAICIEEGKHYIDVSDHRSFYQQVIHQQKASQKAGITAILNTGVFPGISNSMVRQGVEQLDETDTIHLSYVVAGSGGAGLTVMRTTFLGLRNPFQAWIDGKWRTIFPYTKREVVEFPEPYGKTGVYWFDVPETYTFADSFKAKTIITKFGSIPDFYNHLTWITAHIFPSAWIESKQGIEFFSKVSYKMTEVTDKLTGVGVAMRAEITGTKDGKKANYLSTMVHDNTAFAAGCGTGCVAEYILLGKIDKSGIYPVEQALSTDLFTQAMKKRNIKIEQRLTTF